MKMRRRMVRTMTRRKMRKNMFMRMKMIMRMNRATIEKTAPKRPGPWEPTG